MPVYEYVCLGCEERFDSRRGLDDVDPDCPRCGEDRVRRQFSLFASTGNGGTMSAGGGGCACGGACACGH